MCGSDILRNVPRRVDAVESERVPRALLGSIPSIAGLAAIVGVFWWIGWPGIRANLLAVGPWFLGILALNLVAQAAFVLGLRSVLPPGPSRPRFSRLYAVYLMGDAASYVAPASGEALKVVLLSSPEGAESAAAAVTLHKQADLFAQCTFAVVGVGVALWRFTLPRAIAWAAIAGAVVLVGLLVLMTWALWRGAFSPIVRRLAGWKLLGARAKRLERGAHAVDARIQRFHAGERASFLSAVAASLAGWCGGFLETWIVLALLAPSAGWSTALTIESLAMVLSNVVFFVPGKLGGAEGIRTGLFVLVGLPPSQGAAYALVRRSRELLWVLPGWALLFRTRLRGDRRAVPAEIRAT